MTSVEELSQKSVTTLSEASCHVCGDRSSRGMETYSLPFGVTSDCRPWPYPLAVVHCSRCGVVQAPIGPDWRSKAAAIYKEYETYKAAGGEEQKVGEAGSSGALHARSKALIEWLSSLKLLPSQGEAIDLGCGRGSFLRAFGERHPKWGLHGTEFDQKNLALLRRIPGFQGLQTGAFHKMTGQFDFFSMIHVLEHLEDPISCLRALREKARSGAWLLVQVPDWRSNPFALTIADHATHFTPASLVAVTQAAGWEAVMPVTPVIPKELTLLAKAGKSASGISQDGSKEDSRKLASYLQWLNQVGQQAREVSSHSRNFGIFGTAVAGTWLTGFCRDRVAFFVDEDPDRIGSTHMGMPILAPSHLANDAEVLVGMAPQVADRLVGKYKTSIARFHGVPPLPDP